MVLLEISPVMVAVPQGDDIALPPASSCTAGGTFPVKTGELVQFYKCLQQFITEKIQYGIPWADLTPSDFCERSQ